MNRHSVTRWEGNFGRRQRCDLHPTSAMVWNHIDGHVVQVLLVEDNPGDQVLVREAFKTCPIRIDIRCAEDGEAALNLLSDSGYRPDLILVDLNIPRISGSQVTRFIKKSQSHLRGVPTIIFSAAPHDHGLAAGGPIPADAFFTKPPSVVDYFAIIREICRTWLEPRSPSL